MSHFELSVSKGSLPRIVVLLVKLSCCPSALSFPCLIPADLSTTFSSSEQSGQLAVRFKSPEYPLGYPLGECFRFDRSLGLCTGFSNYIQTGLNQQFALTHVTI